MQASPPHNIKTVTVLGAGLIGSGWAARFLANNINVNVYDSNPHAEHEMRVMIDDAFPKIEALTESPLEKTGHLTWCSNLETALENTDFIQENTPERLDVKRTVLSNIESIVSKDIPIALSSSGLLPTEIQSECEYPERVFIGHPFNPIYIIPLVELVAGDRTSLEIIETASAFYQSLSMYPLKVCREVPGYIANRLQEALWREALHLVADGVATTEEVDASILYAVGLRMPIMGPFLTAHLAGGEGGISHMLEQFAPVLNSPVSKLIAPELTPKLGQQIVTELEAQVRDQTIKELETKRDDFLIQLIKLLHSQKIGIGTEHS